MKGREERAESNSPLCMGAPNIFRTTSTCHCPFVPLPFCPCPTPLSPNTKASNTASVHTQQLHTHTHTYTLGASGHFSHNSAWLPLSDWQETGRVRTTSCEYGKRQKIIENLAFMNLWWESVGWRGLCLWLNQSIACVVCVWLPTEVEINRAWTRPRQLQTLQLGTFVLAISPCPLCSCYR